MGRMLWEPQGEGATKHSGEIKVKKECVMKEMTQEPDYKA